MVREIKNKSILLCGLVLSLDAAVTAEDPHNTDACEEKNFLLSFSDEIKEQEYADFNEKYAVLKG